MTETSATAINRGIQHILTVIATGLLAWVAYSVVNLQQQAVEANIKLSMLIERQREMVPRAENEMRWESLGKRTDINADRIARVEQQLMQRKP